MQKGKEANVNYGEGFEKLSSAEVKYDLFSTVFEGIPLWLYGRDRALNILAGVTSYEGQSISAHKISLITVAGRIFYFFTNFFKLFNNDLIIFTSERNLEKDTEKQKYYNPFAELVLNENTEHKKPLIIEFPLAMTKKYKKTVYERYLTLDALLCLRQFSYLFFWLYYKINKDFSKNLKDSALFSDTEIKELVDRCYRSAHTIRIFSFILKFFKLINPKAKLIYSCMGGFDKFPGVIEIQPALITDYSSVYIYPQTEPIKKYLQNKKIIVTSLATKQLLTKNGYTEENIKVKDNPKIKYFFLKNVKSIRAANGSAKNKMVIIGNWGGGLLEIMQGIVLGIEKNSGCFKDWEIVMILHPTEKNTYKNFKCKKIKIYENHEVSLWENLLDAVCTVDISSTVIQESDYFGCFNIIVKAKKFESQAEYVESLSGQYPYKEIVEPEKFIDWFKINEQMLKNHKAEKSKILEHKYNYFLKK